MEVSNNFKPKYKSHSQNSFSDLRIKVNYLVKDLTPKKHYQLQIKAILFPITYVLLYFMALTFGQNKQIYFLCFGLMGVMIVIIFLNLIHEAVHKTIFRNKKSWNKLYVYLFDVLGANSYIWKIRHIRCHHAFPNVLGWDTDFEQSPLAKVYPQAPKETLHKYQHYYLPFLYPLFLFNWLLVRDFKDFFIKTQLVRKVASIPRIEYVKLFAFKVFFISYLIVIPKFVLDLSWLTVINGFIILVLSASLLSLLVLLTPHASVHSEFPKVSEDGNLPHAWVEHQLRTTNDISNDNWFIRFFMGSFNYHIAHHLFPNVSHIYYPEITPLIKSFAEANDLPYRSESLFGALKCHYDLIKQNALEESIFEEVL